MSFLDKLKTTANVEKDKDRIGGGFLVDNDIYLCKIKHAYFSESEKKALALNVALVTEDGKTIRQQFWMTSNEEKGCKNTYEKDGKNYYLPGFNMANHLCLLTAGTEIGESDVEEKLLTVYNAAAGAEAPTKVECLVDLFGKEVYAAVQRQIVDKTTKENNYQPTGETKEVNEVVKFFHYETKQTVTEAEAESEGVFFETWKKEFAGKPAIDRSTKLGAAGAPAKAGGAPGAAAGAGKKTATLFGKK